MSFGVGVGDILLVTKIGFKLWVNVRGSKKEREDLVENLMDWRDKLKILDSMIANAQLPPEAIGHAKKQLAEALLTLQVLEELNNKLVKGKVLRQAAWEVCGRAQFEKYQTELKERVETINSLFLCGSVAMITDTVQETNVMVKQINGMKHMGFSPDYEPIRFIDALNGQHLLPWEYCRTWEDFRSLVQRGFKESAGRSFVERGEYDIINEESGAVLRMEDWTTINPGTLLSMAIVIRKRMEKGKVEHRCPGCETLYTGSVGIELERVKCTYCGRWFQVSSEPRVREIDTTKQPKGLGSRASSGDPSKGDELIHIHRFHVRVNETRFRSEQWFQVGQREKGQQWWFEQQGEWRELRAVRAVRAVRYSGSQSSRIEVLED